MSGPYIQYAAVRSGALLEKARYISSELSIVDIIGEEHYAPDRLLTVQLGYFEAKVQKAFAEYKPHILAGYLYDVANEFNKFYAHVPSIIDCTDTTLRSQRLFLVQLTHKVLVQGLQLLSIRVPSEM
jgi:arginyl-tRNA synthetase